MFKKLIYIIFYFFISIGFSDESKITKEELTEIIKEFIMENPSVLIQSLEQYREKAELEIKNQANKKIKEFYFEKKFNKYPFIGEKESNIIVTEFIDYNCGYCKKTIHTINKLYKNIKNIKIVFVDLPILSETSEMAAKASLASHEQDSYFQFHSELLNYKGTIDKKVILEIAQKLKLDLKQFKKDMLSEKIDKKLEYNMQLAEGLNIRGTPTFIIGNKILPGAYEYGKLEEIIYQQKERL